MPSFPFEPLPGIERTAFDIATGLIPDIAMAESFQLLARTSMACLVCSRAFIVRNEDITTRRAFSLEIYFSLREYMYFLKLLLIAYRLPCSYQGP